jgi:SAM-dependent methyltransferase
MAYPGFVADYYDTIYSVVRSGIDTDYYLGEVAKAGGPVLEIGVGTGRFFMEALARGADIYGIDISEPMIDVLKDKLETRHHQRIWVEDILQMNLNRTFDLIIAPFRVFSHILTVEEQLRALNKVYDHLNDNGRFIFDLYVPNLSYLVQGINEQVDFEGIYRGQKLTRVTSMKADLINQVSWVTMTFHLVEGKKLRSDTWTFPMRFYFRYEIEHLIRRSKLHLVKIMGDFAGNDLQPDSKEFIIVCGKIKP